MRLGISVHVTTVVRGSFSNFQLGVVPSRNYLDLCLQQVSFLGQVLSLSKGVPLRARFSVYSAAHPSPLFSSPSMHLLYLWLLLRSHFFRVLHAYDASSASSKDTLLFLLRCFGCSILESFCEGFI